MFRASSAQTSLLEPAYSLSPAKHARLAKTWAWAFRAQCLPLIDETAFAACYCAENGRPNVPVRVVIGILLLKEMFDYTDTEALEAVEYDLRWQTALGLTVDASAPCQKTLHNFRTLLAEKARVQAVFTTTTDRLKAALGVNTDRQRLDSTQICSNIALLSRLSRFCETHRLLLHRLARFAPTALPRIAVSVQQRYVRADGTDSTYDDARSSEGRRRLAVCARDAWRLVDALRGVDLPVPVADAYALVERLLDEQCLVLTTPAVPQPDDADAMESPVPARLREKGEVAAQGLQSPHDPDATYGYKGTGYTVTLCETVGNGACPELITHMTLTTAFAADQLQTVPTVEALDARGIRPTELLGDGSFASTENLLACHQLGTDLVGPVTGGSGPTTETPRILVCCLPDAPPSACSVGVLALETKREQATTHIRYYVRFAADGCAGCPQADRCPATVQADGTRLYRSTEIDAINTYRRWRETTALYKDRYRWRSGIEATNSECKRAHGLGKLRVRGWKPVLVAVFLKGLACNIKRALAYWAHATAKPGQIPHNAVLEPRLSAWGHLLRLSMCRKAPKNLRFHYSVSIAAYAA